MHKNVSSGHLAPFVAILFTIAAAATTAACGGNSPDPATPAPNLEKGGEHVGHGDHEHGGKGEHHGKLPPPVHEFHEVMGPLWHMEKGAERIGKRR